MAGSHLAPSSSSRSNKNTSRSAETERRARSRAAERDYERDYDPDLGGGYDDRDEDYTPRRTARTPERSAGRDTGRAPRQRDYDYDDYDRGGNGGGGGWKTAVLIVLLIVVLAAIGFLVWKLFGAQIMGLFGGGGKDSPPPAASVAPGITTQVTAEYENGKSVSGNMAISQGTQRLPDELAGSTTAQVLDVTWADGKEPEEPVYVTVSDPSFPNDEGLAVYNYVEDELIPGEGQWNLVGTYAIRDNSVTFLADTPSAIALEVISANPATPTPAPSTEPALTPTPMPTPSPTPAPIMAVDYGAYGQVQSGVYAQVDEIEDDQVYIVALVRDMPTDANEQPEDTAGEDTADEADTAEDGGMTISYVDADTGADVPVPDTSAPAEAYTGPTASVLMNLDGANMRTVEMNMFQTDDGTWCLDGDITAGMLWTANRDYYNGGYRYSLGNNEVFINLADDGTNMTLNDNHVKTRFLIEDAEMADGSTVQTLTYADNGRHYINNMQMIADAVTPDDFPATGNTSGDDVQGQVIPSGHVLYLGSGLMPESDAVAREVLQFTVSDNEADALQVMLFKLDSSIAAPASSTAPAASRIVVPTVDETTNLSFLEVRDGDKILQNGVDYTVNARVYNDTVVVVVRFMGDYTGQVVRTYPGTKVLCNDVFTEASPSPSPSASPSPSPTPAVTPEGQATAAPTATPPTTEQGPGPVQPTDNPATNTPEPPPSTVTEAPNITDAPQTNPPSTDPESSTNTGSSGGSSGSSDTNT